VEPIEKPLLRGVSIRRGLVVPRKNISKETAKRSAESFCHDKSSPKGFGPAKGSPKHFAKRSPKSVGSAERSPKAFGPDKGLSSPKGSDKGSRKGSRKGFKENKIDLSDINDEKISHQFSQSDSDESKSTS